MQDSASSLPLSPEDGFSLFLKLPLYSMSLPSTGFSVLSVLILRSLPRIWLLSSFLTTPLMFSALLIQLDRWNTPTGTFWILLPTTSTLLKLFIFLQCGREGLVNQSHRHFWEGNHKWSQIEGRSPKEGQSAGSLSWQSRPPAGWPLNTMVSCCCDSLPPPKKKKIVSKLFKRNWSSWYRDPSVRRGLSPPWASSSIPLFYSWGKWGPPCHPVPPGPGSAGRVLTLLPRSITLSLSDFLSHVEMSLGTSGNWKLR